MTSRYHDVTTPEKKRAKKLRAFMHFFAVSAAYERRWHGNEVIVDRIGSKEVVMMKGGVGDGVAKSEVFCYSWTKHNYVAAKFGG